MKYLLVIFLFFVFYSCDNTDTNSASCNNISCEENEICTIKNNKAVCECDTNFYKDGDKCISNDTLCENFECGENESCKIEDSKAICECKEGFTLEDGKCINPLCETHECEINEHCTIRGDEAICECNEGFYIKNGKCVNNEILCESHNCEENEHCIVDSYIATCICNDSFHTENSECVSDKKEVDCREGNKPLNSYSVVEKVTINYINNSWEETPYCSWACNDDYIQEGEQCINSRQVPCKDNTPMDNAHKRNKFVEITYSSLNGWTEPVNCEWECNINYILEDELCINSKMVNCDDSPPENAHTTEVVEVEITYNSNVGWSTIPTCSWACNNDYISEDNSSCINSKMVECTPADIPANGSPIFADVEIIYTELNGWTEPSNCEWECNSDVESCNGLDDDCNTVIDDINGTVCDNGCNTESNECIECGNGVLDPGEVCDDGNTENQDECRGDCMMGATPTHKVLVVAYINATHYYQWGTELKNNVALAGGDVTYLFNPVDGTVRDTLNANHFDQLWFYDLDSTTKNWPIDAQAIADFHDALAVKNIIVDGRMTGDLWHPPFSKPIIENYYSILAESGGGAVYITDHYVFCDYMFDHVMANIGYNGCSGSFYGELPFDHENRLMQYPNTIDYLYNDSSTGAVPYGLQPNGEILYSLGWYGGNVDTPAISTTIEGEVGFHVNITAPDSGTNVCRTFSREFTADTTNGSGATTYVWKSNIDGDLGTGNPATLTFTTEGTHAITVTATDSANHVDNDTIQIIVTGISSSCGF